MPITANRAISARARPAKVKWTRGARRKEARERTTSPIIPDASSSRRRLDVYVGGYWAPASGLPDALA